MVAEAAHVFVFADDADAVFIDFQPCFVHRRARKFAVQRVRVFRRGAAAGQQPGMEGEAAVGIDDFAAALRFLEHVVHPQAFAVKHCIPDDLPHQRQNFHKAPRIGDFQSGDVLRIRKGGYGKLVGLQHNLRYISLLLSLFVFNGIFQTASRFCTGRLKTRQRF